MEFETFTFLKVLIIFNNMVAYLNCSMHCTIICLSGGNHYCYDNVWYVCVKVFKKVKCNYKRLKTFFNIFFSFYASV